MLSTRRLLPSTNRLHAFVSNCTRNATFSPRFTRLHRRERIYRLRVSFSFNENLSIASLCLLLRLHLLLYFFSFYFCIRNWAQVFDTRRYISRVILFTLVLFKFRWLLYFFRKKKKRLFFIRTYVRYTWQRWQKYLKRVKYLAYNFYFQRLLHAQYGFLNGCPQ